jgi:hypothetical protein
MESLAFLVIFLLLLMAGAGLASIYLTFRKTNELSNLTYKPIQRLFSLFLAVIALLIGLQFATQVNSLGGKLIGCFGIATALIAFYRVFKR